MHKDPTKDSKAAAPLLEWYDVHARTLPWRIPPYQSQSGVLPDPYHVWLSEIMLQQTQVKTVIPYFFKFVRNWPTLQELAQADIEDVLKAWAGLGYYSRARNLKKCAEQLVEDYDGMFPQDAVTLKKLAGIGEYTSAAIAAIAFGEPVAVVDGNVERVICRLYGLKEPVKQIKAHIKSQTQKHVPTSRPGDFAQAMMDLGATLCSPKKPSCLVCPLQYQCLAHQQDNPEDYPVKAPKKEVPLRQGAAFVAVSRDQEIFLRKRPGTGMLAGMSEPPSTQWSARQDGDISISAAPLPGKWVFAGTVQHRFTHFQLEMKVYHARFKDPVKKDNELEGWWVSRSKIMDEALPNLMKKAVSLALETMDADDE